MINLVTQLASTMLEEHECHGGGWVGEAHRLSGIRRLGVGGLSSTVPVSPVTPKLSALEQQGRRIISRGFWSSKVPTRHSGRGVPLVAQQ